MTSPTTERFSIFAPIAKFNEETGEVSGYIAEEAPDRSGEIMDYAKSRPYFHDWSETQKAASGGKSLGNVREMHTKSAIGKLTHLEYLDDKKQIFVTAKVVDAAAREKVREGVLTGFSIGGSYADKWADNGLTRYVASPSEVSLVDRPCMPGAVFTVVKADGSEEERPLVGRVVKQVWDCGVAGHAHAAKAEALACETPPAEKAERTDDASPKEGESKYGDVKFADAENKKYPIDTAAHIRAAWNYINKGKNAAKYTDGGKSVKAKIVAAWKAKIDKAGPPSAEKLAADAAALRKCMYCVQDLAAAVAALDGIQMRVEYEAEVERDDSPLPAALQGLVEQAGELLIQLTEEETGEMRDDDESEMQQWSHGRLQKLGARVKEFLEKHTEGDEMKPEELQKVLGDNNDALMKRFEESVEKVVDGKLAKIEERLDKIESVTPSRKVTLRAVGKEQDDPDLTKVEEKAPEDSLGLTKLALRNPVAVIAGARGNR